MNSDHTAWGAGPSKKAGLCARGSQPAAGLAYTAQNCFFFFFKIPKGNSLHAGLTAQNGGLCVIYRGDFASFLRWGKTQNDILKYKYKDGNLQQLGEKNGESCREKFSLSYPRQRPLVGADWAPRGAPLEGNSPCTSKSKPSLPAKGRV